MVNLKIARKIFVQSTYFLFSYSAVFLVFSILLLVQKFIFLNILALKFETREEVA
jgi:hypothetical protein